MTIVKDINDFEIKEALSIIQERVTELRANKEKSPTDQSSQDILDKTANQTAAYKKDDDVCSVISSTSSRSDGSTKKHRPTTESSIQQEKEWNSSTKVEEGSKTRVITITADSEMAENIAKIHSKASLGQVVQKASICTPSYSIPIVTHHEKHHAQPTLHFVGEVISTDDRGNQERVLVKMRKDKTNVQNLPYMYRCPSI